MLLWVSLQSRCYRKVRLHFNSHTRAAAVLFYQRQKKNFFVFTNFKIWLSCALSLCEHIGTQSYIRDAVLPRCCKLAHKVIFFIHLVFFLYLFLFSFPFSCLFCFLTSFRAQRRWVLFTHYICIFCYCARNSMGFCWLWALLRRLQPSSSFLRALNTVTVRFELRNCRFALFSCLWR